MQNLWDLCAACTLVVYSLFFHSASLCFAHIHICGVMCDSVCTRISATRPCAWLHTHTRTQQLISVLDWWIILWSFYNEISVYIVVDSLFVGLCGSIFFVLRLIFGGRNMCWRHFYYSTMVEIITRISYDKEKYRKRVEFSFKWNMSYQKRNKSDTVYVWLYHWLRDMMRHKNSRDKLIA